MPQLHLQSLYVQDQWVKKMGMWAQSSCIYHLFLIHSTCTLCAGITEGRKWECELTLRAYSKLSWPKLRYLQEYRTRVNVEWRTLSVYHPTQTLILTSERCATESTDTEQVRSVGQWALHLHVYIVHLHVYHLLVLYIYMCIYIYICIYMYFIFICFIYMCI